MTDMKKLLSLGLVGVLTAGAMLSASSAMAQDAKKEAPKKEAKAAKGPNLGMFAAWAKDLGLDEAQQTKLAEIAAKQREYDTEFKNANGAKLAELDKALKEARAAGKADEAKAKTTEIAKVREEQIKKNAEFRAQALAVLTPEQQKKLIVTAAQKQALLYNPFKALQLTPEQVATINSKIEAAADSLVGADKELDRKKLSDLVQQIAKDVLTDEQKAQLAAPKAKPAAPATEKK